MRLFLLLLSAIGTIVVLLAVWLGDIPIQGQESFVPSQVPGLFLGLLGRPRRCPFAHLFQGAVTGLGANDQFPVFDYSLYHLGRYPPLLVADGNDELPFQVPPPGGYDVMFFQDGSGLG